MSYVVAAMMIGAALIGAHDKKKMGKKEAARAEEQRLHNEIAAGQAVAIGQRAAFEEERQAELMASRAVAVAAAGGAGQDIDNLIADIHGEGSYRASLAMFEAESEAERIRFEGQQGVRLGMDKKRAYDNQATATLLSGFTDAYGAGLYSTRRTP